MVKKKTITRFQEYADSIINTMRESLIALDQNLKVVSASRSFYEFFMVKPDETVRRHSPGKIFSYWIRLY